MRMIRRTGENILHHAFGELARALILLQDDQNSNTGFDIGTNLTIHDCLLSLKDISVVLSDSEGPLAWYGISLNMVEIFGHEERSFRMTHDTVM